MKRNIFSKLFSALYTFEFVILCVYISCTYFHFEIPVLVEYERISICYTSSYSPTLISIIGKWGKIHLTELKIIRNITYIIYSSYSMKSQKMSWKTVAEPITEFRLDHCVLPQHFFRHHPWIIITRKIEGPFRRKTYLCTKIDCCCSIIKDICL